MRFDIYGRCQIEVLRADGCWRLYRLEGGKRRPFSDFAIPAGLPPHEIATYLDDMLHEMAQPGRTIRPID